MNKLLSASLAALLPLVACTSQPKKPAHLEDLGQGRVSVAPFGRTADGISTRVYTLESPSGVVAKVTDHGATLTELWVPDRKWETADVVLGFDEVSGYESEANQYFGCTVGRVANRIADGMFELEGKAYNLAVNNGPNHLHGGLRGFDKVVWESQEHAAEDGVGVLLQLTSPAGDEGYPGEVRVWVTYTLTTSGDLRIDYKARTDARTPLNLTHHSYFNLAGAGAETVLDHELTLSAAHYTPCDEFLIPTGAIEPVDGTPLDFREARTFAERISALEEDPATGYDHNFVVDGEAGTLRHAATLEHPASGRRMEIHTTEPGLQLYTGNFLMGQRGKGGATYAHRSAVCLEAQHFPDSINQPLFPSIVVEAGQSYSQTTVHKFSAR